MLRYLANGYRQLSGRGHANWRPNWEFYAVLDGHCAPVFHDIDWPELQVEVMALDEAGYPQPLVHALIEAAAALVPAGVVREVSALDVDEGMVLEQDVVTRTGMVLVRKGERVTRTLALRIHNFAGSVGVVEPITVLAGQALDAPSPDG